VSRVVLVAGDDAVTQALAARLGCAVVAPGTAVEAEVAVYRPTTKELKPDAAEAESVLAVLGPVPQVVVLSSTAALDPSHHNPGFVDESYRSQGSNPIAAAWRQLEDLAAARLRELVVLRPAPVVTRGRGGDDFFSRLLSSRAAVVPPGFDPALQFLALEDLVEAVAAAVEKGLGKPGLYHVAPRSVISVRGALRLAGARRVPLAWATSPQLGYLRHNTTVSGEKTARELGFVPKRTSAEAIADAFGRGATQLPSFDDFGLDPPYVRAYGRTLFRFLHDVYWRIEFAGLEHVPRQGRAVLAGVHRGFMPWDGVMLHHLIVRELGRHPRFLIHPCLVKLPFLANYMTKLGGIVACQENADWVLGQDELLGMFPEGIHGAFTPYREAYKLGKFGRDEFVKMALRNRAPIVPFVTVGSAEIYPILGRIDWKWVKRLTEWLYLPITPTFPFPGLPLPSKWHTLFLPPLAVHQLYGPEAADDPAVVRAISQDVRRRMEAAFADLLARRKSIFWGSLFSRRDETQDGQTSPMGH
jgi:1-acyl-sn-glycerol-3-phosphate acyltransferase